MAKATVVTNVVEVTLVLSEDEAVTLHDLIGRGVVGPPRSRRRFISSIYLALEEAGIKSGPRDGDGFYTFVDRG